MLEKMAWVRVGSARALTPGTLADVTVAGVRLAVCNVEGSLHALHGICPHMGAPLGQGNLQDGHVICPWHAWAFDCRTGQFGYHEETRIATYPIRAEGDDLLVDVPDRA